MIGGMNFSAITQESSHGFTAKQLTLKIIQIKKKLL